jgi:hypothetical protein
MYLLLCRAGRAPWLQWLLAILLLACLPARPAQAATGHGGKARPGPLCLPVAALLGAPGASGTTTEGSAAPVNTQSTDPQPVSAPAINQDVCVAAHVYQVVELPDGTRFLDVCPATVPDADCRFLFLSMPADHDEVGNLQQLGGADIQLRGTLRQIHGRFGIYLSHARQLQGGPEKFRPNPRLLQDFDASSDHPAVRDPNLRPSGHRRSFMNRALKEPSTAP